MLAHKTNNRKNSSGFSVFDGPGLLPLLGHPHKQQPTLNWGRGGEPIHTDLSLKRPILMLADFCEINLLI